MSNTNLALVPNIPTTTLAPEENLESEKSLFEFDDYRKILAELIRRRKQSGKTFSYRWFAKQAGFQSPNFLKLVVDGQRDLSSESIEKVIRVFKLSGPESAYFRNLVLLQKSKSLEEKDLYARQILKLKNYLVAFPLSESQFRYYSDWYHVAIRELVLRPDFTEDPNWIAKTLIPNITPHEAGKSLQLLLSLGLLRRDPQGKLEVSHQSLQSGDRVSRSAVATFHKKMMGLGQESIARFAPELREITCVTTPLSEKNLTKLKQMISDFKKEILKMSEDETNKERIVQINFQMFPVSQKISEES